MNLSAFFIGACTTFFIIFAIHILWWRKDRTRFQTTLGCIMAVWAVSCLKDIILTFPNMYSEEILNWVTIADGWLALTFMVFLFEVVMPGWMTIKRFSYHVVPFALISIAYLLWPTQTVIYIYWGFLWCYAWFIVIFGYFKSKKYINYVKKNFSNIDKIDISWLKPVFLFSIISQLSWLFTSMYASAIVDVIYYLSAIVMWLLVLYYTWDFRPIEIENEQKSDIMAQPMPTLPPGKLEKLVEEQELYLNPNLTLNDLVVAMNSNRTYVSNYFSQQLDSTFYDYINRLRINKKSVPLMNEHPEYTFEYIANKSGFASISTFRRAFIKVTGTTPSHYVGNNNQK